MRERQGYHIESFDEFLPEGSITERADTAYDEQLKAEAFQPNEVAYHPRLITPEYRATLIEHSMAFSRFLQNFTASPESQDIVDSLPFSRLLGELGLPKAGGPITSTIRYDMGIVGKQEQDNPPTLLEINTMDSGGYDISKVNSMFLRANPHLSGKIESEDVLAHLMGNLGRKGSSFILVSDAENMSDASEHLMITEDAPKYGLRSRFMTQTDFFDELKGGSIRIADGKTYRDGERYDFLVLRCLAELSKAEKDAENLERLIAENPEIYDSFQLVKLEDKRLFEYFSDPRFVSRYAEGRDAEMISSMIPKTATYTGTIGEEERPSYILKHSTSHCGRAILFADQDAEKIAAIDRPHEWIRQEKVPLNRIRTDLGTGVADLSVFQMLDQRQPEQFRYAGMFTRANTNGGYLVNISKGGVEVPTFTLRR